MRVETHRRNLILASFVLVLGLPLRVMAGGPLPLPSGEPVLTSIAVTAPTTTLTSLGATAQLTVTATRSDGASRDLTEASLGTIYQSDRPDLVTVDPNGLVTAESKGTATIYVNHGSLMATLRLTVRPPRLLDEGCIATVLNRQVQVSPAGTFAIGNVPVPFGAFRVRVVCERPDKIENAQSPFVLGIPFGETVLGAISFAATDPIPISLAITSPASVLTPSAPGAQLVTTGALNDGTQIDLTLNDSGTFYLISNAGIATVSRDGFVSAVSSGTVLITATHEGVIATIALQVSLAVDSDGSNAPGTDCSTQARCEATSDSLHYDGLALDLRSGNLTEDQRNDIEEALNDLNDDNEAECDYQVIYHWNHFHVQCR